ncbi:MAG: hypothetical protein ACKVUS_05540 [Saprospiraceae bacterium]
MNLPKLRHAKVYELFRNGLLIPEETIKSILKLPRATLAEDLHKIIKHGLDNFDAYFEKTEPDDEDWNKHDGYFMLHAVMLLGEMRHEESLPLLLEVQRQESDFTDFWFSLDFTESTWQSLLLCGQNQLDVLLDFMREPNDSARDTAGYTNVAIAVVRLILLNPHRKPEVIAWFDALLAYYIENEDDAQILDLETATFVILELQYIKSTKLLPHIKYFYDNQLIEPDIMEDDYDSYVKEMQNASLAEKLPRFFPNVLEWYKLMREEAIRNLAREQEIKNSPWYPAYLNYLRRRKNKKGEVESSDIPGAAR